MIYIQREGGPIRNGLNFYSLLDKNSAGVIVRIKRHVWRFRYSKIAKKFTIVHQVADKI